MLVRSIPNIPIELNKYDTSKSVFGLMITDNNAKEKGDRIDPYNFGMIFLEFFIAEEQFLNNNQIINTRMLNLILKLDNFL